MELETENESRLQGSQYAADNSGSRAEVVFRRSDHGRGDLQSVRQSARRTADLQQFVSDG